MEFREEGGEPVSPTGQYFNSSILSVAILAVLEFEVPFNDSQALSLLQDVFLPINPRFSSIMISDKADQKKQWKRVEVKLEDHVRVPIFPSKMSPQSYDEYFDDYISNIAAERLPQNRPLWEIHILKYPTSHAAGTLIFKLHHALGDGYSLMGALLSCLQSAQNPSVPLTFPSLKSSSGPKTTHMTKTVSQFFSSVFHTVSDFSWSILKSNFVEDDRTPIRSGEDGVEFRPITLSTLTFSIDEIKLIKNKLRVTINDVIAGIIFLGTRIYMQEVTQKSSNERCTALVLLRTRNMEGYLSTKEMIEPDNANMSWGNQFAFLHLPVPKSSETLNPLDFVWEAQKMIKKKKSSAASYLTSWLLDVLKKFRGPEGAARYIHGTHKNSSMTISNMIGPVEKMALDNQPVGGLYFMVVGSPQCLTVTALSYMGKLRVAFGAEKGFIDSQKLKASMQNAFGVILEASNPIPPAKAA
ncbi:PREDICTED: O-acyltransferase [Prunus dulcis]|uniref:PREDICTED: O-acyltransferase n=1 Tax=Prunus dulcis TaxID=3755 RepID=A0A5E4FF32_PRUDU|nr:O-acyltransferase WSD1-like [Prunus dulcis]VVA26462.1 PREDICTED: O-acyltransferase [Prunus dulcis]